MIKLSGLIFIIFLIYAFLIPDLHAAPSVKITFESYATNTPVNFTTDRAMVLKVKITGLKPKEKSVVELQYGFANQEYKVKADRKKANKHGEIEFSKLVSLFKYYKRNSGKDESAKLFTAFAILKDSKDENVTVTKAWGDLLVMPKGNAKIYRLNSEALCQWQEDTRIDSEYFFNNEKTTMHIIRVNSTTVRRGVTMELTVETAGLANLNIPIFKPATTTTTPTTPSPGTINPTPGQITPLGSSIYAGANFSKTTEKKETYEMEYNWGLLSGQGGFVFRRTTYTRYKAIKYEKEGGEYVAKEEGILNVGQDGLGFAVVPRSMAADPELSLQFIDKIAKKINKCDTSPVQNFSSYVLENNDLQMLYMPYGDLK